MLVLVTFERITALGGLPSGSVHCQLNLPSPATVQERVRLSALILTGEGREGATEGSITACYKVSEGVNSTPLDSLLMNGYIITGKFCPLPPLFTTFLKLIVWCSIITVWYQLGPLHLCDTVYMHKESANGFIATLTNNYSDCLSTFFLIDYYVP